MAPHPCRMPPLRHRLCDTTLAPPDALRLTAPDAVPLLTGPLADAGRRAASAFRCVPAATALTYHPMTTELAARAEGDAPARSH